MNPPVVAPASDGAVIRMTDVHKIYQVGPSAVPALKGVSVTIERGSFWAVMGASGSGKSTLLNLFGCLDRPTRGIYLLDGRDVATLDDDERSEVRLHKLGFIFQSFHLIPQLTVRENIELPLYYQGWHAAESRARAEELAERMELSDRLGHRPMELSGGQRQRVAIARSLANDPAVILADEPTGNLDTTTSRVIMELLAELHRQGRTIILVTHEEEIAAYAHTHMYLRDGAILRIEEQG
jgi:putative ABC transport system ATP-binding protein